MPKIFNAPLMMTWLEMLVRFGMWIILLPLATARLETEELAFFLFIGTLLGMAYLAEGGINRVILRAMAFFHNGAETLPQNIEEVPLCGAKGKNAPNYNLIGKLVATSFYVYIAVAIVSVLILVSVGFLSAENILEKQPGSSYPVATFLVLAVFAFMYTTSLRWVGLIQGIGGLTRQKRAETAVGLVRLALSALALQLGYGVLGVAIAMVVSISIASIVYRKMFFALCPSSNLKMHNSFDINLLKMIWPSGWRQSVLAWGSYLIYQGSILVVAQVDDTLMMASYFLTLQIIILLTRVANAPAYSQYPKFSEAVANQDGSEYRKLLLGSVGVSLGIYLSGAVALYFLGEHALNLIGSSATLLSGWLLVFILLMYLLELNHVIHATIYTATNHIPFVIPALFSGLLILLGGIAVIEEHGIKGVILVQFLVQLSFNNWYPIVLNIRLMKKMSRSKISELQRSTF